MHLSPDDYTLALALNDEDKRKKMIPFLSKTKFFSQEQQQLSNTLCKPGFTFQGFFKEYGKAAIYYALEISCALTRQQERDKK